MKQWFEDWQITLNPGNRAVLSILLPNSRSEHTHFELFENQVITKEILSELNGILGSAFDQIQRDNGGYGK